MLGLAQNDGWQRGGKKGLIAGRLLVKGSRVKALKAVRRHIVRSINAQLARESKERPSKATARKDRKQTYALTILALPTDGI